MKKLRVFSLLLALILCFSVVPATAFASKAEEKKAELVSKEDTRTKEADLYDSVIQEQDPESDGDPESGIGGISTIAGIASDGSEQADSLVTQLVDTVGTTDPDSETIRTDQEEKAGFVDWSRENSAEPAATTEAMIDVQSLSDVSVSTARYAVCKSDPAELQESFETDNESESNRSQISLDSETTGYALADDLLELIYLGRTSGESDNLNVSRGLLGTAIQRAAELIVDCSTTGASEMSQESSSGSVSEECFSKGLPVTVDYNGIVTVHNSDADTITAKLSSVQQVISTDETILAQKLKASGADGAVDAKIEDADEEYDLGEEDPLDDGQGVDDTSFSGQKEQISEDRDDSLIAADSTDSNTAHSPQTGEIINPILMSVVFGLAVLAGVFLFLAGRRRQEKNINWFMNSSAIPNMSIRPAFQICIPGGPMWSGWRCIQQSPADIVQTAIKPN